MKLAIWKESHQFSKNTVGHAKYAQKLNGKMYYSFTAIGDTHSSLAYEDELELIEIRPEKYEKVILALLRGVNFLAIDEDNSDTLTLEQKVARRIVEEVTQNSEKLKYL